MKQRLCAIGLFFCLLGVLIPGCDWYGNLWDSGPNSCCIAPDTYFDCSVFMTPNAAPTGPGAYADCRIHVGDCFRSESDAKTVAVAYATGSVPAAKVDGFVPVICYPGTCGKVGVRPPAAAPQDFRSPQDPPPQGYPSPEDYPSCDAVMADAGAPTNCIATVPGEETCSMCLNTCCAEYTACQPASECAAMVDYWQGTGPAAGGQASPDVASLDTCFTNAGCNDVDICGAKARAPSPGGL